MKLRKEEKQVSMALVLSIVALGFRDGAVDYNRDGLTSYSNVERVLLSLYKANDSKSHHEDNASIANKREINI
jgi:hypothetical protein